VTCGKCKGEGVIRVRVDIDGILYYDDEKVCDVCWGGLDG
jgi:hypothetical protein